MYGRRSLSLSILPTVWTHLHRSFQDSSDASYQEHIRDRRETKKKNNPNRPKLISEREREIQRSPKLGYQKIERNSDLFLFSSQIRKRKPRGRPHVSRPVTEISSQSFCLKERRDPFFHALPLSISFCAQRSFPFTFSLCQTTILLYFIVKI